MMKSMMRLIIQIVLTVLTIAYPFVVVWALKHGDVIWISGILIMMAVLRYFAKSVLFNVFTPLSLIAIFCGVVSLLSQHEFALKMYPVLMSLGSLVIFAYTLKYPPTMIERFARLHQPDLPESGVRWTRKVTQVWCGFFIINACLAFATVMWGSATQWAWYNGFIAYILMGILLIGEFILRKIYQKRHAEAEHHSS